MEFKINGHIIETVYNEYSEIPDYLREFYGDNYYDESAGPHYRLYDTYEPADNSYCIDIETGKSVLIVQSNYYDNYRCTRCETGAKFSIVSEPYYDLVYEPFLDLLSSLRFIDVKSSKTDKIYRVLFNGKFN